MATKKENKYEVIVGNIGMVHACNSRREAVLIYNTYVDRSKFSIGRCVNESVCLMADNKPLLEYLPPTNDEDLA